jgi:sodium/bile acid cotransporter 7
MLRKQWFLLALMLVLCVGMGFAPALQPLAEIPALKWTIVAVTMFLMVWKFSFGDITDTIRKPKAALLAAAINTFAMSILIWPFSLLVGSEIGAGMIITFASPCTLVSAAVWTRRAGGDDRIAIMVTLITNLLCFVTSPFWVWLQLGGSSESTISFTDTLVKLLMFVVAPIGVAQLCRLHSRSARWATENKKALGIASQIGILLIVLLGSIPSGIRLRESGGDFPFVELAIGIACLLLVHVVVLYAGRHIAKLVGMTEAEQIAVAFAGSQKTLMIGLTIAVGLKVSILPLLAYHSLQLVIDTVIADRFIAENQK